jgi:hypothetical protein
MSYYSRELSAWLLWFEFWSIRPYQRLVDAPREDNIFLILLASYQRLCAETDATRNAYTPQLIKNSSLSVRIHEMQTSIMHS